MANRNRQRNHQSERRTKRQQHQGRRELPDQPFRRCGDDGKWKGKLGFCQGSKSFWLFCTASPSSASLSLSNKKKKALTCPPLIKPANGSVSPLSCATGDAAPNQRCYFTCDPGFRVTGNPVRACLPSLKWNPLRPPPACEKGNNSFLSFLLRPPLRTLWGSLKPFQSFILTLPRSTTTKTHPHKCRTCLALPVFLFYFCD